MDEQQQLPTFPPSSSQQVSKLNKEKVKKFIKDACTFDQVKNKFPILKWLPKYRLSHFQGDVVAGLTVGLTVIPQGLALSKVAGLPPQYGLYTAFMGCFMYVIFGTSKDITVGPTAVMSLLVGRFGTSVVPGDPTYAIILTFIGGLIQFLLGFCHLGLVVDFVSHPVIDAFTNAAAITIAEGQVKNWLGLKNVPRDFLEELYWTLRKIPETRIWDFLLGLVCFIMLMFLKYMNRLPCCKARSSTEPSSFRRVFNYSMWLISIARNAIVVLMSALIVLICQECYNIRPFTTTGNVTAGLPPFKMPSFTLVNGNQTITTGEIFAHIGPGFLIVPLLGLVETMAIGKVFAKKNGYKIDSSQEFVAIGLCNVASSFVSSFPVTGSFSRTAVNSASGVKTPAGGITTGLLVIISLLFLTPYFHYIPGATLAVVIMCAVIDMINFKLIVRLWKINKIDLFCWVVTFVLSLVIGIEYGILAGIGLSLVILLCMWGRPKIEDITAESLQFIDSRILYGNSFSPDVLVLKVEHGMLFPSVERFAAAVSDKLLPGDDKPRAGIIDCSQVVKIDYSVIEGVHGLLQELEIKDCMLVWIQLKPSIEEDMRKGKLHHFHTAATVEEAVRIIQNVFKPLNGITIIQNSKKLEDPTVEFQPTTEGMANGDFSSKF